LEYSIAADCTNLVLECTNSNAKWSIDYSTGYASTSSVYAVGNIDASMTCNISGTGTLTFRVKAYSSDTVEKLFHFYDIRNGILAADEVKCGYTKMTADGNWIMCTHYKDDDARVPYMWYYYSSNPNDSVHIDQVRWYPDRQVTVDSDNSWITSEQEINNITESVLARWDYILPEDVAMVRIDATREDKTETLNSSVTNALALLSLGYAPEYSVNGTEATLTFANAPSLNISAFDASLLPETGLTVSVTNTAWGLPDWSNGVEYVLGVWGAPSLTSAWSRVDSSCDLSRYLTEGVAVFDFDVGTNRFFKVKAE
jgi:hypothetical protein